MRKFISHQILTKSIQEGILDDFIKELASNLMLEELLRDEADPVEFLKEQMVEASNRCRVNLSEKYLKLLKKGVGIE